MTRVFSHQRQVGQVV